MLLCVQKRCISYLLPQWCCITKPTKPQWHAILNIYCSCTYGGQLRSSDALEQVCLCICRLSGCQLSQAILAWGNEETTLHHDLLMAMTEAWESSLSSLCGFAYPGHFIWMESYNMWPFVSGLSLNLMSSRFIHTEACIRTSCFKWLNNIPLWIDHILFVHASVNGHLGS